ncbi:GGDEF domain-containing protein [Paenibacillus sp. 481]|uniref:GGDEF domain-containing protein n=1 Tax=Paenibacillus sp. 481 TaxID=2835869 RepID=UPI001E5604C5|nr:GGDEF domain-containing protein [Paenibacillus sp. 481]UHA72652.1 GGDEF domain-containing protein [Paenibacillus sp. 481]
MNMPLMTWSGVGNMVALTSACMVYITFIILLMTLRLYSRQRSNAYLLLSASLVLMALDKAIYLMDGLIFHEAPQAIGVGRACLQTLSFLLVNLSVLRLYKRFSHQIRARFGLLFAGIIGASLLCFIIEPDAKTAFGSAWPLLVYHFILTIVCYAWIAPRINQRLKYTLSLIVHFLTLLLVTINWMLFGGQQAELIVLEHLMPLIYYTLLFFILFERIVEHLQVTYRSSITDGLTQLYNRRYVLHTMQQYVQKGMRLSFIFCDIDNFKKLNDTYGHDHADDVLKHVSNIIKEEVEDYGIPGRFGGEELVAVIVDADEAVARIAEQIRKRVELEAQVTISVGYSTWHHKLSIDELVRQSDQAMYFSKTSGKNRVTSFKKMNSSDDTSEHAARKDHKGVTDENATISSEEKNLPPRKSRAKRKSLS